MLTAMQLPRIFTYKPGSQNLFLDDPDPTQQMTPKQVRDFYAGTYPELAAATVIGPVMENDKVTYQFKSVFGTKG